MAKQWTPEEEKFLFENYSTYSLDEWVERYGTTKKAISNKMSKLRKIYSQKPKEKGAKGQREEPVIRERKPLPEQWSPEEEKLLFGQTEQKKTAKQWTLEEEKFLFEKYNAYSLDEWAERFGTSKKAISNKMSKLRKTFPQQPQEISAESQKEEPITDEKKAFPKQWSPEEEKLLFNHYHEYTVNEWARRFNVTRKAVINKMSSLRKKLAKKKEETEVIKKKSPPPKPKKYKLVPSPYEIKTADGWQQIMMRVVDE